MLAVHANIFQFMLQHPRKDEREREYGGVHSYSEIIPGLQKD